MNLSGRRPHDAFFTAYFSRPAAFAQLLEFTLPAEVYSMLDLSTLSIDTGSYIDEHLRRHFSDLAATVRVSAQAHGAADTPLSAPAGDAGSPLSPPSADPDVGAGTANVYVLVEHKSYKDSSALLQILRYMVRIWSEQQKTATGETRSLIGRTLGDALRAR